MSGSRCAAVAGVGRPGDPLDRELPQRGLGSYDDAQGKVVVATSISVETIYLTALEVGADGTQTLYFYAGFLS